MALDSYKDSLLDRAQLKIKLFRNEFTLVRPISSKMTVLGWATKWKSECSKCWKLHLCLCDYLLEQDMEMYFVALISSYNCVRSMQHDWQMLRASALHSPAVA